MHGLQSGPKRLKTRPQRPHAQHASGKLRLWISADASSGGPKCLGLSHETLPFGLYCSSGNLGAFGGMQEVSVSGSAPEDL